MRMSLEWWRGGVDFSSQKKEKIVMGRPVQINSFLSKKSTDPDPASYMMKQKIKTIWKEGTKR